MTTTLTLMGAGGKMGCRITDMIKNDESYDVRYVEPSGQGRERLAERGVSVTSEDEALDGADAVVMAVPDELMGTIAEGVVPKLDSGAMLITLDPAAAYAGELPEREDIVHFITHPCHPPVFNDETDPEARTDWFGGRGLAKQNIVCALHSGPEEDYERGEAIAKDIFAPVMNAYRVTTEEMAILEPALSESLSGACMRIVREGMEEAVEMGVPEEAARAFLMGHLRISMVIEFDKGDFPYSDGAEHAIEEARDQIFRDDWKENIFDREAVRESADDIATPE